MLDRAMVVLALAGAACGPVSALSAAAPALTNADDIAKAYRDIVDTRSDAVVTLKFVLKTSGMGEDAEEEQEALGLMIEETGLVLTSNILLGGIPEAQKAAMAGRGGFNRSPKDLKVLIGDDHEGVDAKLVARDSELDLAWVQITDAAGKSFARVDLSQSVKVGVGDGLVCVQRFGKIHDREPVIAEGRVRAIIHKPRRLIVPSRDMEYAVAGPIFTTKGELVGVGALQFVSPDEMRALSDGVPDILSMSVMRAALVLPAEDVLLATERGKEAAKSGKPVDEEPPPAEAPEGEQAEAPAAATGQPPADPPVDPPADAPK